LRRATIDERLGSAGSGNPGETTFMIANAI
jgi:hypothetical protein